MPELEAHKYQYAYDPLVALAFQHVAHEHIGIKNPPAPCCGSRATKRKTMQERTANRVLFPLDINLTLDAAPSSSIHEQSSSGVRIVHDGKTPFPRLVTSAIYRIVQHEPGCGSIRHYFSAMSARTLAKLPPNVRIKAPCDPMGALGTGHGHGRTFVRAVKEDTLRGGEGYATYSAIEASKLEEAFGEASRGYAAATKQWLGFLRADVGSGIGIVSGMKVDDSRLIRHFLLRRLNNMPLGRAFKPLQRPESCGAPSSDAVGEVIEAASTVAIPSLRRQIQAVATKVVSLNRAVTFDHCEPMARAVALNGDVIDVQKRQGFQGVDCSTGRNLGGVFVPGTGAAHVRPYMMSLGERTNYSTVVVDNAGVNNALYSDCLGIDAGHVRQGLGHLDRRVSGTFHAACLLKKAACVQFARIATDFDSEEVDDTLKMALVTPGGFPAGCRIQIKAADRDAGLKSVLRTWGTNDAITQQAMMAMVKDGSFASTFSEERAPIRNPMATKLLRFEAWKGHYNPLVADGDGGDGHQRFLRRDDNGISLYSEDTPRALSNFYATLVNYMIKCLGSFQNYLGSTCTT